MKKLLFLLLPVLASSLFAGEYPDISVKELQAALKDGKVAVIDVNGKNLFRVVISRLRLIFLPKEKVFQNYCRAIRVH